MSVTISKLLKVSVLKTIRFNLHYFGIKGLLKPKAIIAKGVQFKSLNGSVTVDNDKPFILKIGFPSLGTRNDSSTKGTLDINGNWIIHDKCSFAKGASVSISKNAIFECGSVDVTGDTNFICSKKITIGNNCMISWGGVYYGYRLP